MAEHLPGHDAGENATGAEAGDRNALIIRAEQALLGAIMSDPAGQAAVLDLVRPGDMLRPYHGQVLAAMQRLRAGGVAPDPVAVRAELTADPDLTPRDALDGVLLVNLLEAAPRPRHAPAYAAMVIDHGIRQHLALAGSRMTQAAETGDLDSARRMTAQASRTVQACQERWDSLPEQVRRQLSASSAGRAAHGEEAAWQLSAASQEIAQARQEATAGAPGDLADRLAKIAGHVASAAAASRSAGRDSLRGTREARPASQAAVTAGEHLLRDLAAGPGQVAAVRSWLDPGYFARPAHGLLYALIRDMHAAGKPADPVTIAWEASHRGITVDPADLVGGTAAFAVADAREVRTYGLLARICQAGRDVGAAAGDPRVPAGGLARRAGQWLARLERESAPQVGPQPAQNAPRRRLASTAPPSPVGRGTSSARPCRQPQAQASDAVAEPA